MRIRRPCLHPPASKSKAFAKVVTFRREDAEKTEEMQGTRSRQIGESEERDSEEMGRKVNDETVEKERGGEERDGVVRERLSA